MPDHEDQITESEGPSPTEEDDDPGRALEDYISDMDHTLGVRDGLTQARRAGGTIDEEARRERRSRDRVETSVDLTDDGNGDGLDEESQLFAEADEPDQGPLAPEQAAVHIVMDLPGAVDHPDDYVDG
jgi:hypothetical protein